MFASVEPRGATMSFSSAGLAEGTNANTYKINAANGAGVDFAISGLCYHKADTDNIAMSAHAVQAVSTTCLYLVCLNSSGTASTIKGTAVLTADLTAGNKVLNWPTPTDDLCPIGAIKVVTDGSTTFTAATTDLGAAGITDTYYNFGGGMPHEPLAS